MPKPKREGSERVNLLINASLRTKIKHEAVNERTSESAQIEDNLLLAQTIKLLLIEDEEFSKLNNEKINNRLERLRQEIYKQ